MGPLYTGQLNNTMPSRSWAHTHMFKHDPRFAWYRWSQANLSKSDPNGSGDAQRKLWPR